MNKVNNMNGKEKLKVKGAVDLVLFDKNGRIKDSRFIPNTVMAVGDAYIADQLSDSSEAAMSHMAIGEDDTAPNATDTTLGTEIVRVALTSTTQGTGADDNDVIYIGEFGADVGTGAICEAGIFNSAATDDGTMLCRTTFAVINKDSDDTLKITWTLTLGDS